MTGPEKQEVAEPMAELLLSGGKVISAVGEAICQCPNRVVGY